MPDSALLLSLAEIAGVFVGFGALISVRSREASDPHTLVYLRAVMWMGLWVIVAALVPVAISRYGVTGRPLWLASGLLGLVLYLVLWTADARSPEIGAEKAGTPRTLVVRYAAIGLPISALLLCALVLVSVGAWPELEPALYFTAVTLGLLLAGFTLVMLVFTSH